MRVILSITLTILLLSCGKENEQAFISPEELTADSLQNYADSLAKLRRLHSQYSGRHIHAPGSDLAEAAHQNIPGKRRMRNYANKQKESRKQAAAVHAERVLMTLKKCKKENSSL